MYRLYTVDLGELDELIPKISMLDLKTVCEGSLAQRLKKARKVFRPKGHMTETKGV